MVVVAQTGIVYRNPRPELRSIHTWHPTIVRFADGELLCTFDLAAADVAMDYRTWGSRSTDGGATWSAPVDATQALDRADNPAVAISPDGTDVYLVYNAYLDPFRTTTATPRRMQGVALHADVGAGGVLGGFTTLHRAAVGDARGTTRTLNGELIYDYQYAVASRDYGAVIWMDARDATVCPAVNDYRQSLIDGSPITAPAPLTDCPPTFGNLDNYSGSYLDPTP